MGRIKKNIWVIVFLILVSFSFALDKDDFFTGLKENNPSKTTAYFDLTNPTFETIDKSNLGFEFNEVCGEVLSYSFKIKSTCYKTRQKPIYDWVEKCTTEILDNKTNDKKTTCETVYDVVDFQQEITPYTCYKETNYLPIGTKEYELKINPKWSNCGDGYGYKIDWVPTLTYYGTEFTKQEWAWFNSSWSYSNTISYPITTTTTEYNITVPIVIDTKTLISAGKLQSNCDDLRFLSADNTTIYDYSIYYNDSAYGCNTTHTTAWVKIKEWASGSSFSFNMFYGNPTATNGQIPISEVWDSDTVYVFTFGNCSGLNSPDDTGILTPTGTGFSYNASVQVNKTSCSINLGDGDDNFYIDTNDEGTNYEQGAFTMDSWFLPVTEATYDNQYEIYMSREGDGDGMNLFLYRDQNYYCSAYDGSSQVFATTSGITGVNLDKYSYAVMTWNDSGSVCIYANGLNVGCATDSVSSQDITASGFIGTRESNTGQLFSGQISFFRISSVHRSNSWIKINSLYSSYSFGTEEFEVPNTAPTTNSINIYPPTIYSDSTLNCSILGVDSEQQNLTAYFWWVLNGSVIDEYNATNTGTNNTLIYTDTLYNGTLNVGLNISCFGYVNDGTASSNILNNSRYINERPPEPTKTQYLIDLDLTTTSGVMLFGFLILFWLILFVLSKIFSNLLLTIFAFVTGFLFAFAFIPIHPVVAVFMAVFNLVGLFTYFIG